jgi:hypothetical protein
MLYSGCDGGKFVSVSIPHLHSESARLITKFEQGITSISSHNNILAVGRSVQSCLI